MGDNDRGFNVAALLLPGETLSDLVNNNHRDFLQLNSGFLCQNDSKTLCTP